MPMFSVISVTDYVITGTDYIITGTDYIIAGYDYKIDWLQNNFLCQEKHVNFRVGKLLFAFKTHEKRRECFFSRSRQG